MKDRYKRPEPSTKRAVLVEKGVKAAGNGSGGGSGSGKRS